MFVGYQLIFLTGKIIKEKAQLYLQVGLFLF